MPRASRRTRRRAHSALCAVAQRTTPARRYSSPTARKSGPSPTSRSRCCRTSPPRRSSRWRTRGSSPRRARRWNSRPRLPRCLQVINSSPGDLAPVFDAMLEKAMRLCGAAFGHVATYDGEQLRRGRRAGVPAALAEFCAKQPSGQPGPGTAPARSRCAGERVVHIADDLRTMRLIGRASRCGAPMVDLGGARTMLAVPLRKDDALLGDHHGLPPGSPAVLRQADRAVAEFRGAGGDRDGECPAARRNPPASGRIAGHLRQHGRWRRHVRRRPAAGGVEPQFPGIARPARRGSGRASELRRLPPHPRRTRRIRHRRHRGGTQPPPRKHRPGIARSNGRGPMAGSSRSAGMRCQMGASSSFTATSPNANARRPKSVPPGTPPKQPFAT